MKNKNSFTRKEFLKLRFSSCPFCESDGEDIVQWYDEKTKTSHFACLSCDYYSEEKFTFINWVKKDGK